MKLKIQNQEIEKKEEDKNLERNVEGVNKIWEDKQIKKDFENWKKQAKEKIFKVCIVEAIIYSMTLEERTSPSIINPSRKKRIANGAGVDISEVNRLIKQFEQGKKMMKKMSGMMSGKKGRKGLFGKMPFGM